MMEPRVSLITLGVADVARARAFYEALGWTASQASQPEVAFFQGNGLALALWSREALAEDAGVENTEPGFAGIALAYNGRSKAEVDEVFARAKAVGGRPLKPPQDTSWGGYSGYFADPDGHPWEVAHNPGFPLDEGGRITIP